MPEPKKENPAEISAEDGNQAGITHTIGEDIRKLIIEVDVAEWIELLYASEQKPELGDELPPQQEFAVSLRDLKSRSGSAAEFIAALQELGESNPAVAACILKVSFEFLSNIDQIRDMVTEWKHGIDVINWRIDRISDSFDRMSKNLQDFIDGE